MLAELCIGTGFAIVGGIVTWGFISYSAANTVTKKVDKDCPIDVDNFINLIKTSVVKYSTYKTEGGNNHIIAKSDDGKIQFSVCAKEGWTYKAAENCNFWVRLDNVDEYFAVSTNVRQRILQEINDSRRNSLNDKIMELQLNQAKDFIEKHTKEQESANKKL